MRFGYYEKPVTQVGVSNADKLKAAKLPKRFFFAGVLNRKVCLSVGVAHLGYLARGFVKVFDLRPGAVRPVVERGFLIPGGFGVRFDENPSRARAEAAMPGYGSVRMEQSGDTLQVTADVRGTSVEIELELGDSPLRVCSRNGIGGWTYTEKRAGLAVKRARVSGEDWGQTVETLESAESVGVTDWTYGLFRMETFWQWACFAARMEDGRRLAGNITVGLNETGFTDNCLWTQDSPKRELLAATVIEFDSARIDEEPWRIRDAQKRLDLLARPLRFSLDETNIGLLKSRFRQGIAEFTGTVEPYGRIVEGLGFLEDFEARW